MSHVLERRSVSPNTIIVRQNDQGKAAYLIQSGCVVVFTEDDGKYIELAKLYAGDIFGEMALVYDDFRSASVKSMENTTLIVIDRDVFEKKLENSDPTIRAMLTMLMERLLQSNRSSMKKSSNVDGLSNDIENLCDAALESLPRNRQRTFKNSVFPKLEEIFDAIKSFQSRYVDD